MRRMQALPRVALVAVLAALLAGCASGAQQVPSASPAPPQQADLGWVERAPATGPGLVFEVRRLVVTSDGWQADVAIRNDSGVAWSLAKPPGTETFGLMLFATGQMAELERRNEGGDLPGLRRARSIVPAPPSVLEPGGRWSATISAPGALAAGRWVRLVFGTLSTESPPEGLRSPLIWITDRAHALHG
jgi:hypothetical protein